MSSELIELAGLTEDGGSFSLEYNPQRALYETVEQYLDDHPEVGGGSDEFESPGEHRRAIESNTLVILQWYPRTPIGFYYWQAPDLESLLRWKPWLNVDLGGNTRAACKTCGLPKAARRSRIAELGGNPNWCWSGCGGYDAPPMPAELGGDDNAAEDEEMQNA